MADETLNRTPADRRGKGRRSPADPAPKRIDLLAELADEPEPPAAPPARTPLPKKPAPVAAPDTRSDLGGRRWSGSGPVPPGKAGDVLIVLALLAAGVIGLALTTRAGAKVPAAYRPAGWAAAAGLGAAALFGLARRVRGRRINVAAFEHGLAYTAGGRTRTLRWEDVTAVTERRVAVLDDAGRPDGFRHLIRLRLRTGAEHRLEVGGVADSEKLSELLHAGTLPHLMPRVVEQVTAGEPAAFGRLTVAPHGLLHGRRRLPWAEVGGIDVENGVLVVRRRGQADPWYAEDCGATPNLQVLLNLIRTRFLTPDPHAGRCTAADESRYSVLDKYMQVGGVPRRY